MEKSRNFKNAYFSADTIKEVFDQKVKLFDNKKFL